MHISDDNMLYTDVDELLENWERIRHIHVPIKLETVSQAVVREYAKNTIDNHAHKIRVSRLKNDRNEEIYFIGKFTELYKKYYEDLTFRILKSEQTFSNNFRSVI